ncbi:PilN domain-containing protein [Pseudomonas piscis]
MLFSRDERFWTGDVGQLQPALAPSTSGPPVLVLLPHQRLLHEVSLPAAVAQDLTSMLSFEMDKYTPFKASQVYFDCVRLPSTHDSLIRIRLAVVSRERLDALLDQAQQAGHSIMAVDVLDEHGARLHVDLLAPHRRAQIRRSLIQPLPVLALVALILALASLQLWLHNRQQALEDMQQQVKTLQQQTQQVQALNRQIDDTLNAQRYVVERRAQSRSMAALLNELTQCIPLNTTLESLDINPDGQVSLTGQSSQASALISAMKACRSLEGINFQGAIQPDPVTGLDRFSMLATLRKAEASHAPATNPR